LEKDLRARLWPDIIAGDILFKMRCRTLPYEQVAGDTVETLEGCISEAVRRIESDTMDWGIYIKETAQKFMRIPVSGRDRPLIGVVGEIYVRCNAFANNHIVEDIEHLGGEAWLAPVSEWILYTSWMERYLSTKHKTGWMNSIGKSAKWKYLSGKEHKLYGFADAMLHDRKEPDIGEIIETARSLLPPDFAGESILTVGRAMHFKNDGADLVVNCVPFGCMHGNITETIFEQMREQIGIPVVTVYYDGMGDNSILSTYLHDIIARSKTKSSARKKGISPLPPP
jgi:predicted nucleotide-binding protein (sugar kinase/HSP70/actin superfamily)